MSFSSEGLLDQNDRVGPIRKTQVRIRCEEGIADAGGICHPILLIFHLFPERRDSS